MSFSIFQGGLDVLRYYNGSLFRALTKAYPALCFNCESSVYYKGTFLVFIFSFQNLLDWLLRSDGWTVLRRLRKLFDDFAESKQFDPLDSENWYSVFRKDIVVVSLCTSLSPCPCS